MTLQDFSDNFDTLANAYGQRQGFGGQDALAFDEYEKSVFLTKAQDSLVIGHYTGRVPSSEGFERTEEERRYLSALVCEKTLKPCAKKGGCHIGIDGSSAFFRLPRNLWFITYESVTVGSDDCHDGAVLDVVPVTQDEYHKTRRDPFRGANGRRALRLDLSCDTVEIVSKYAVRSYYVRYIARCCPIILCDLPDGMSIKGISTATECRLHDALHQPILEMAVAMAVGSRGAK